MWRCALWSAAVAAVVEAAEMGEEAEVVFIGVFLGWMGLCGGSYIAFQDKKNISKRHHHDQSDKLVTWSDTGV
jgi:hypothetical protein